MKAYVSTLMAYGALFVLILTGCGQATTSSAVQPDSGIRGRTTVDGGCGALSRDQPCPEKALSAKLTVSKAGSAKVVATVTSDEAGRYVLPLAPGDYVVTGASSDGSPLPFAKPIEVTVTQHAFTSMIVRFDSGIR
jgi:hypothetical protein